MPAADKQEKGAAIRTTVVFKLRHASLLLLLAGPVCSAELDLPEVALQSVAFDIEIAGDDAEGLRLGAGGTEFPATRTDDGWRFEDVILEETGSARLHLSRSGTVLESVDIRVIPGWTSMLPPLIAIVLALVTRSVIPALFVGIWIGAWSVYGYSLTGLLNSLLASFQRFVANAVSNPDHVAIMLFTFMIGGMVGVVSRNGGVQALVDRVIHWAHSPQRGQLATWFLGLIVFFDDYANTLIVGNTARPVTDSLRISREKLAYLVDSTAAPVATVAVVTTWVGFQVGLIRDSIVDLPLEASAFELYLRSIPYSFYPWLAILFILMVIATRRDFGPMYTAERRTRTTGELMAPTAIVTGDAQDEAMQPVENKPLRVVNVVLPVLVLVSGVFVGLWITGSEEGASGFWEIISNADSYRSLMWASLSAVVVAMGLSTAQRILTLNQTIEAWYAGVRFMLYGLIILVLAWALAEVTDVVHTADFLVSVLGDWLSPAFMPALIFGLSGAVAFATGSSWGAMGILAPLVLPLSWAVMANADMLGAEHLHIFYSTVASVLAGAVWGDHCSPISDTTILSSLASGCDHIDHVRTQLPYAMLVGVVAVSLGSLAVGSGLPWWATYLAGIPLLLMALLFLGKSADAPITQ